MRKSLWVVTIGLGLVLCAMLVVLLVMVDKEHFGGLVTGAFLPAVTSGVIVGGLATLIGALMLPERKSWRGAVLIVWALVAVTSPLFGFLFLLPWALLAITIPLVIWVVATLRRAPQPS